MKPIRTFTVTPVLPKALEPLREIGLNLWWAWHDDASELFRRLDRDLWEATYHNPVLMLGRISQAQLDAAAADEGFLAHLERVHQALQAYLQSESASWYREAHDGGQGPLIAYFSAEFGITECLSIFAGGLGLLAGDHVKAASDLGLPLVGVGLLYQQGYFRQYLSESGWQQEAYDDNDFHTLPLTLERRPDGAPLTVAVEYPGRTVTAQVWRLQVGRVPLYLLDTNVPENWPEDRDITDQLYGGDIEMRIKQEIMLGIGGYRALEALGLRPTVYHMNEGHSAFLALERVRRLMETRGLPFPAAREAASAGLVFTTHTPVPAGHDYFSPDLMDRYFGAYYPRLGLSRHEFLGLGRQNPYDEGQAFSMTVLALRLAAYSNGVSQLHGQVSREMFQGLWPDVPVDEIPIGHVTNGVHLETWVSDDMQQLYDRYLGPRWREDPSSREAWQRVERIPAEELWRTHERQRERLVAFARQRLRQQLERRGASQRRVAAADEVLDPDVLTIGFSRRFAAYKRATLLFRDPERLARILNDPERPVQIIFAGKAHPRDDQGKELIRQVVTYANQEQFRRRLVFLEDYDMVIAYHLVQGADVWLNNPRRPLEASGTSGMKAAANGALNVSTLDGWWDEAWRSVDVSEHPIGWAIGRGETYADPEEQDRVEAEALYDLLERSVIPTFYDRGVDGLPRRWIARMKASIEMLCPVFNTHRMLREYTDRFYVPALERHARLVAEDYAGAKALAEWKQRVAAAWPEVRVLAVDGESAERLPVGGVARASATVRLGTLGPEDVLVQLYYGPVNADGEIVDAGAVPMRAVGPAREDGVYRFEGQAAPACQSGLHGYTVRVLPCHDGLVTPFLPGLIAWASRAD